MRSPLRRWAPVLAPLLVLFVYIRTLDAPFMWDDNHVILDSPRVTTLQPIGSYFDQAFWTSSEPREQRGYYRPLTTLSFALDYRASPANPFGFHLTNLLLHALNVLLLYVLLRRFRVAPSLAFGLVLLWGLHPRLTEAVAWIAGRTDVLATTFVLAALVVYRPHRLARMVAATLLVFLAMLSREVAAAGVVALAIAELVLVHRREPVPFLKRAALALLPVAALVAYLILQQRAVAGVSPSSTLGAGRRALLALETVGMYARMVAFPWHPQLQIGDTASPQAPMIVAGALTLLVLAVLARRFRALWLTPRDNVQPLVVLGSCVALASLGLVLHVIPIALNVIAADRLLYLPLAAGALLVAPLVQRWALGSTRRLALGGALAISFAGATFVRAGDWCSELELWSKTYRETPRGNGVPGNELGGLYARAGLFEQAAAIYPRAERNGRRMMQWPNHAKALAELGEYDAALEELSVLGEHFPKVGTYDLERGRVELQRLRFDESRAFVRSAIARDGVSAAAGIVLAVIPRVEALVASPEYESSDTLTRTTRRFDVADLAGQRPAALELAEALLALPEAPKITRRRAAEYWLSHGPPREALRVLSGASASDVVDQAMLARAKERARAADELLRVFATLGAGRSGT
jgi:protein O-mannosyl-transferase